MTQSGTATDRLVNFAHLDRLSADVNLGGETCRIVHIYCETPDYCHVPDPAEGTACVDDVARAAVLFLRHYELTGDDTSRHKAEAMLRFVLYMQAPNGLFFNFVGDGDLRINRTHIRSQAVKVEWWTARAVWALGTASSVLREANPPLAEACDEAVSRVVPHIWRLFEHYPRTVHYLGRTVPTWLLYGHGADATSELVLGLVPLQRSRSDPQLREMIDRFAEGLAIMRYGSMNRFPFGMHASNRHEWHHWGNSQTQALAEAGLTDSASREADEFYARLLVEGFLHSITFDRLHAVRYYERVASGIRSIAVGLLRLYGVTNETRFARMAGLAAGWLLGNNAAERAIYDAETGRCFDAVDDRGQVNLNSGAESTIEALLTLCEIEQCPEARAWINVQGGPTIEAQRDGQRYLFRVFRDRTDHDKAIAVVMNLTAERTDVLTGPELRHFLP